MQMELRARLAGGRRQRLEELGGEGAQWLGVGGWAHENSFQVLTWGAGLSPRVQSGDHIGMWGVQNVLGLFPLHKAPRAGTRKTMASLFPGPSNKAHSLWQLDRQDAAGLILLWGLFALFFYECRPACSKTPQVGICWPQFGGIGLLLSSWFT